VLIGIPFIYKKGSVFKSLIRLLMFSQSGFFKNTILVYIPFPNNIWY